jgi:fluoride exporter
MFYPFSYSQNRLGFDARRGQPGRQVKCSQTDPEGRQAVPQGRRRSRKLQYPSGLLADRAERGEPPRESHAEEGAETGRAGGGARAEKAEESTPQKVDPENLEGDIPNEFSRRYNGGESFSDAESERGANAASQGGQRAQVRGGGKGSRGHDLGKGKEGEMTLLWVFLGGSLGAWARYWITLAVQRHAARGSTGEAAFPWGTLTINVLGSFFLGLSFSAAARTGWGPEFQAALEAGVLGAFTTYSTLALETTGLAQAGRRGWAVAYALGSLALGVLAWILGARLMGAPLGGG